MNELVAEVNRAETNELKRAGKKFGRYNHSSHESYAVLLEEFEETEFEIQSAKNKLRLYWDDVKAEDESAQHYSLLDMENYMLLAACEAIQTAAMCRKAIRTIYREKEKAQKPEAEHGQE